MESEFYVANLARSDDEARRLVEEFLGWWNPLTRDNVVSALYQHGEFAALQEHLDEEQGVSPRQDPPNGDDLHWLLKEGRETLGDLLGWNPSESFQRLFSLDQLFQMLVDAQIIGNASSEDAEGLLKTFLDKGSSRKLVKFRGTSDRLELLQDLLQDQARKRLARALVCPPEEVLRYLIVYIKDRHQIITPSPTHMPLSAGTSFDFIGLSKLRGMVRRFQYTLLEQSKSHADFSKARLPGHRIPALLPALIRFYTGREFKIAIEDLLDTKQSLRQMGFEVETLSEVEAPREAKMKAVTDTSDGGNLVIQCLPQPTGSPVEILRIRGLQQDEQKHIQRNLPETVGDLSEAGTNLPDRVLNTLFPLFSRWKRKLREAIDDAFVPFFVLSKPSLNPKSIVPELEVIDYPETDNHPSDRVEFPKNVQDIANLLNGAYAQQGKHLKPIKL